jgi:hypothetical protein
LSPYLLVNTLDTLVIPFEPLDVTQIQIAKTEAPVSVVVGQTDQPSYRFIVLSIEFTLVALEMLADAKCYTGNPYAYA